jgi:hypothetical protein
MTTTITPEMTDQLGELMTRFKVPTITAKGHPQVRDAGATTHHRRFSRRPKSSSTGGDNAGPSGC